MSSQTDNKKSSALDRKLETYPHPKYHKMVVAYSQLHEVSKSEVVSTSIKNFFDNLPPTEKTLLMRQISCEK